MIKELTLLIQGGYFGGGALGRLFASWEQAGVFTYMLPFLLIFALVFGLLSTLKLFKKEDGKPNAGINAIIALAVGLMSLQFDMVSVFFAEIFPRLGIGIAIILVFLILAGLFVKPTKQMGNVMMFVTVGIVIVIVWQSLSAFGWSFASFGGGWFAWNNVWPVLVLVGMVIAVVASGKNPSQEDKPSGAQKLLDNIMGDGGKKSGGL